MKYMTSRARHNSQLQEAFDTEVDDPDIVWLDKSNYELFEMIKEQATIIDKGVSMESYTPVIIVECNGCKYGYDLTLALDFNNRQVLNG